MSAVTSPPSSAQPPPSDSDEDDEDFVPNADSSDSGSDTDGDDADQTVSSVQTEKSKEEAKQREEERRKRVEDLWRSMKSGEAVMQKSTNYLEAYEASLKRNVRKVTQTYEFAGKQFRHTVTPDQAPESAPTATTTSQQPERTAPKQRKSRLKEVAERFGVGHEAAKLTVLEKSKLDWMMHVEEYGDSDRLSYHRKDGYLEKTDFLSRTDQRQAEHVQSLKRVRSRR
ncbi:swr complex subunit [Rhizophlyctis rosea]|uniref:SWR1-complex protein 5 n=1 Tax=Rhizophlyctis rosea TaxID=64517 RepID=A0AAD5X7H3_9FUNG|nr:swr complex subunit [Rhizophlyctis rosea]